LPAQKTNQKRAPEMITFAWPCACYTGLIGATVQTKVRTISGMPAHLILLKLFTTTGLGFRWPQRILGKSECFEACCEGP